MQILNAENNERWWVRVEGREYGPVSRGTLSEWMSEGRLLRTNEVRSEASEDWSAAAGVPGLFAPPPLPEIVAPEATTSPNLAQIIGQSWRLYRRNFLAFFVSTLLVSLPMLALNLTSNIYGIFPPSQATGLTAANLTALLAFTWLVIAWPIYLASIQLIAAASREDRKVSLLSLWRRAINFFPRMAFLSVVVYGSYFFWAILPLIVISGLLADGASLVGIFLALLLLAVQIVMVSRLFVNFMFWQQAAVIAGRDGPAAVRESKILARSTRRPAARPLWRGIVIALIWGLAVLAISTFSELPWALPHFRELSSPDQVFAFLQKMNAGSAHPEPLLIGGAIASSLLNTLLRPIIGIAFVLLYFETRADFTEEELSDTPTNG